MQTKTAPGLSELYINFINYYLVNGYAFTTIIGSNLNMIPLYGAIPALRALTQCC
jgi:hypothetical protein